MSYKIKNTNLKLEDTYFPRDLFLPYSPGNLWGCGYNNYGQLGNNSTLNRSSPIQTVAGSGTWKQLTVGANCSAGIKSDGTLWLWGDNNFGQLGDDTVDAKSSPVQTVAGGTNWRQVTMLGSVTAAIKTDNTLWLWGDNNFGQLGDDTVDAKSSPVQTIIGGNDWKYVTGSPDHIIAMKQNGTLWFCGYNTYGVRSDSVATPGFHSSPVQISAGGYTWSQVSSNTGYAAGITNSGNLYLWGRNDYGQLGDNTVSHKSNAVQTVAGGTNWKKVSCGYTFMSAIKTDGTLWLWGDNNFGQLGDNTTEAKSSPVQTIAGGTNWRSVSAGIHSIAAIKHDGTLWVWGNNDYGQLGNSTVVSSSSPIQIVAGGSNKWVEVSAGQHVLFRSATFVYIPD